MSHKIDRLLSSLDGFLDGAAEDQRHREADRCESKHIGEEGERSTMRLTLVDVLGPLPGQWGDRFGYIFHQGDPGETCNVVIWWTGGKAGVEKGAAETFTATVKEHSEYNGVRQTVITRAKVFNPAVQAAKARRDATGPEVIDGEIVEEN